MPPKGNSKFLVLNGCVDGDTLTNTTHHQDPVLDIIKYNGDITLKLNFGDRYCTQKYHLANK